MPGGRGPGAALAGRLAAAAALAAALAACAKREPPSGGPPDLTPPRVVAATPDSGSAGVALRPTLSLTFSEPMEPRSTGEAVSLAPRVDVERRRWSGRTLTLELAEPLAAGRTYTLFVGGTARDRHGNSMSTGTTVVFSTADTFPPGVIEGEIEARGLTPGAVALWCYDAGTVPDSTARDFDALGLADAEGRFRIAGLTVPGAYRLWAFVDQNGNRSYEPQSDILSAVDTTLALTAERPAAAVRITVINPRAPGTVSGTVEDPTGDSLGTLRVVAVSERDTTRRVGTEAGREGAFELDLDPGPWRLVGFRDRDRSRSWQPDREPASEALAIVVEPGAERPGVVLRLRPPARRE